MAKSTRRVHDAQFKTKVVLETLKAHKTLAQLSSEFGIHATAQAALPDYPVETTSLRGITYPIQWPSESANDRARTGTDRSSLVSTNWPTQSGKRLPQKKITNDLVSDRRCLIEPDHDQLSISQQCELLDIPQASYYYQPVGESIDNLALMARIDKLFTDRPELGVRRMQQELTTTETPINLKRVRRLMRLMSLEAIYSKPNVSKPSEGHQIYPYLLGGVAIEKPNHVWSMDITYIPMANGFLYLCAVIERSGVPVVYPFCTELAPIEHLAG